MGYSHSWYRKQVLPKRKFAAASADCRRIAEYLSREKGIAIAFEMDKPSPPIFDSSVIRFNGLGEEGCETFLVPQDDEISNFGSFCKTNHRPYDIIVCSCLIVLNHHLGRKFTVSSEGNFDSSEWQDAIEACEQVLGYGGEFELHDDRDFGRMAPKGLPFKKTFRSNVASWRFANGWVMLKLSRDDFLLRDFDGRAMGRILVFEDEYYASRFSRGRVLVSANSIDEARKLATVKFLEQRFDYLPELKPFLATFAETWDWTSLAAFGDLLQDRGDMRNSKRVFGYLPRGLVKVS